jgi:hypothetical protein
MEKIRTLKGDPGGEQGAPPENSVSPGRIAYCLLCGKKFGLFRSRHLCGSCGAVCCEGCTRPVPAQLEDITVPVFGQPEGADVCSTCFDEEMSPLREKMYVARTRAPRIDTWPAFYKGTIPVDKARPHQQIASRHFREKPMALDALRVTAAFLDCDLVYDVRYEKEMRTEPDESGQGLKPYPAWRATGIAGVRRRGAGDDKPPAE